MLGRTISHYRIVSQLGAGGMGVVFGAEDVRLGRPVALKFVPEDLARDLQAVERFRNEARAASALNHPHICTIYDIGEDEGRPFIVMELMKGQTLRDRLAAGPMKIHTIVEVGIEIADALDAAHAQGIVHRDIKPANLFIVERGHVKIMDFGLAKLLPDKDGSATTGAVPAAELITAPGVTLGTVAYMSPEQATGDELDGRTDLFSLGVVLYECATNHRPFVGNSSAAILTAILNKAPVAPILYNPDLPLRLQDVINNCLEKDRDLRYQTAADLRADLRRVKRDLESGRSGAVTATGHGQLSGTAAQNAATGTVHAGGRFAGGSGWGAGDSAGRTSGAEGRAADSGGSRDRAGTPGDSAGAAMAGAASSGAAASATAGIAALARRHRVGAALVAMLVLGVVIAWAMLWPRRVEAPQTTAATTAPATSPPAGASPAGAATNVDEQVARAAESLEAKQYRAALSEASDVLVAAPGHAEATRIRDEAQAMIDKADAGIAESRRLLKEGNTRGAARALENARRIDPLAPGIAELAGLVADEFASQAERARRAIEQSQSARNRALPPAPVPSPSNPASPREEKPAAVPVPVPTQPPPAQPPPAQPPPAQSPPAPSKPAASDTAPKTKPADSPAAPSNRGDRSSDNAASSAAEDEAAIRRVVATYGRAIENKDLALFRSVKPNLSGDEERRIEAGFRAVSSQRVAITILSIERKGAQASVLLRRRDTIEAGGRRQTADSQQRLTLARSSGGAWTITDIGR